MRVNEKVRYDHVIVVVLTQFLFLTLRKKLSTNLKMKFRKIHYQKIYFSQQILAVVLLLVCCYFEIEEKEKSL